MNGFETIVAQMIVIWVMVAGLAYMIRGPEGALTVLRWPPMVAFRLIRRAIGGLLIAFGQWVRGDGNRRN